ncbi:autotransporter outer membrane beta-barrel domain-containing protein, partial [Rhizobiaceae sp. 2RAB30]
AYTGQGGVSGFGLGFTNERLPMALRFSEREASFAYSLRRSQVEAKADNRVATAHGKVRGSLAAKTEEGDPSLLAALERSDAGRPSPFESLHGLAPDAPVPDADPMATRFDIWAEGKLARFDANGGDGNFGILHAGVDYLVTPRLLIGLGLQMDATDMDGADRSTIDGTGYLIGPYLTARLTDQLYFDARAAWGRSSNSVSPFGTYSDKFDATRWLVSGALIGRYDIERWRIEPSARLAYFEEETDAYLDSFGLPIPQISIETGVFDFGPKLGYQVELDNGWRLEPFVTLQGIWTFRQKNTGTAATESPGLSGTGLRGRGEMGLTVSGAASFSASVFYDGVGNEDFQSWGGELRLSRPF